MLPAQFSRRVLRGTYALLALHSLEIHPSALRSLAFDLDCSPLDSLAHRTTWLGISQDLGDPDHTAVLLNDVSAPQWYHDLTSNLSSAEAAPTMSPQYLGHLAVAEQSRRSACATATYDLATLQKGTLHVFRPVSHASMGGKAENKFPDAQGKAIRIFR